MQVGAGSITLNGAYLRGPQHPHLRRGKCTQRTIRARARTVITITIHHEAAIRRHW